MNALITNSQILNDSATCFQLERPFRFNKTIAERKIRSFLLKTSLRTLCYCNKFLDQIDANTIIVFDDFPDHFYLSWLLKKTPKKRHIFWYWNPLFVALDPHQIPKEYEVWSFSKADCSSNNFSYNSTFFPRSISWYKQYSSNSNVDFLFIGKNKGRKNDLLSLEDYLRSNGFSTEIDIIRDRNFRIKNRFSKAAISYEDYVQREANSKCVIDLCLSKNAGMSLRPLECAVLGKKLLTNCLEIMDSNLYDPNNIFVLGRDDPKKLASFLSAPFHQVNQDILASYTVEQWLRRFE